MKIPTNTDGVVQNATSLNNSINLKFTDLKNKNTIPAQRATSNNSEPSDVIN